MITRSANHKECEVRNKIVCALPGSECKILREIPTEKNILASDTGMKMTTSVPSCDKNGYFSVILPSIVNAMEAVGRVGGQ